MAQRAQHHTTPTAAGSPPNAPALPAGAFDAIAGEPEFLALAMNVEAEAVRRVAALASGADAAVWQRAVSVLADCAGHVVVSGMGKSGLIGAKLAATLSSLGQPAHFLHPSEAMHGDLGRVRPGDVAVLLSYSGGTEEIVNLAAILRTDGVPRIGISCNHGTHLARLSDVHLAIGDVVEACPLNLAPTASTTAMLAMGDALALAVARRRNFAPDDFHRRHPGGSLGAGLKPVTEALRFQVGVNLPTVTEDQLVGDALRTTGSGRRAGALMVVDAAGRLAGIFTDGDLRRHLHTDGAGLLTRPMKDVMTARPTMLTIDALVRDAVQLVREKRLDEIPVVDLDGKPVGLMDVQDLIAMKIVQED
ncbi:MAG: KpsF/GutQ family sugar-phosphate isomerase [Phycisphaerae bacterium]|nr:KpsF/GutQ family sugar-phosphate isomerase [Phycisphaerae bacterium]